MYTLLFRKGLLEDSLSTLVLLYLRFDVVLIFGGTRGLEESHVLVLLNHLLPLDVLHLTLGLFFKLICERDEQVLLPQLELGLKGTRLQRGIERVIIQG